jgi:hypothetical protein
MLHAYYISTIFAIFNEKMLSLRVDTFSDTNRMKGKVIVVAN